MEPAAMVVTMPDLLERCRADLKEWEEKRRLSMNAGRQNAGNGD
jgi:hypothetical protein